MDEDIVNGVKTAVGYHNYYNIGVYDAVAHVARSLAKAGLRGGWLATHLGHKQPLPEYAVRVGQVRVHHGAPDFQLIIIRRQEEC